MVNNSENVLNIIHEAANRLIPGCRVILFGSRSKGNQSDDSDYDFLIISFTEIDIRLKRAYTAQLRKELANYKIPADIIIQSSDEVQLKKEINGHIVKTAIEEGIEI